MTAKERASRPILNPEDDAPELTEEMLQRATFSVGGKPMSRPPGRPKSAAPKRGTYIRLSQAVLDHFQAGGKGWQTRINETLERAIKRG